MHEATTRNGDKETGDGPISEVDKNEMVIRREALRAITQDTRFELVQTILAHPKQLPTLRELSHANPSKSQSTIRNHLETLIEKNVVEEVELPKDQRTRDLPWKFYGLTESGRKLLEEYDLIGAEGTLQQMYSMIELPDDVKKYAEAPRPNNEGIDNVVEYIQSKKPRAHSVDDQIKLVKAMYEEGIGPDTDGLKQTEIESELDYEFNYSTSTLLNNLEEIGLLEGYSPPGPSTYVISESLDKIINGDVEETVDAEIDALIDHIDDELYRLDMTEFERGGAIAITDGAGKTIRNIIAEEFEVSPAEVETFLKQEDKLSKLNRAVEAIEESDGVSKRENYGKILFRRPANRYRLTTKATSLLV